MSKNTTRRFFMKSSLILSAAPMIIPSTVFGKKHIPPSSDRVTLGHIGVGSMGGVHVSNFLQLHNAQSVAVCDPFTSRRERLVKKINKHYAEKFSIPSFKGCDAYNDFRELLSRDDIDAVIIATPDHWHVPIAISAVKAGKDVYVEKPLGVSVRENLAVRDAVQRYGRIFQYGTQQRSGRNFRFACELVRNGYIGRLHTIHAWCAALDVNAFTPPGGSMTPIPVPEGFDYNMWIGPAPKTPYTVDRCTNSGSYHHYDNSLGFIAGWGAHPLDIAQWGNNTDHTTPVEYNGSGTIAKGGLFESVDSWDFWCTYANGVKMRFMNNGIALPIVRKTFPQARDHGTMFIGTEGWVAVDRTNVYAKSESLLTIKLCPEEIHLYESENHYQNFVDCVKSRRKTICPVEAAVQSDIISHICDISIRVNRKITWDPKKEDIVDDKQASRMLSRPYRSPWRL